jgi:xylulokinase
VSDVTGRAQEIRENSVGASYGDALLAAQLVGDAHGDRWNPVREVVRPAGDTAAGYDETYRLYRTLYTCTADVVHALAARQHR